LFLVDAMAPIAKIYSFPNSFRTAKALIVAKYTGQEVEMSADFQMGKTNKSPEFMAKFPPGTVPAMEFDDFCLWESSAIAYYFASLKHGGKLLGHNAKDHASVVQWLLFAEGALTRAGSEWLIPIWGYRPFNKVTHAKAVEDTKKCLHTLNAHLHHHTYLVTEHITVADIVVVCNLQPLFKHVLEPKYRDEFKNVVRWFVTCMHQSEFKAVFGEPELCKEEAKPVHPKKEEKKDEKKKGEKKKEVHEAEE